MHFKKKIFLVLTALVSFTCSVKADEGMWLPMLLKQMNESDMKRLGMKLSAEDIYNVNKSSLKDAIVQFGGGCTGEMISAEGLLLTNHHCGYSQIQSHSSVQNDYLTKGYWAMNRSQELPNQGLTAMFIVRMEDVTKDVLKDVAGNLPEAEREQKIKANIARVQQEAVAGTHYEALIRPFFYGNEYYMYITETFKDVRLVGAPPSSIGKFGGDTDNWMWPRHTGDFSLFRVYAGKDNKPAAYAADNVPYKPKHHLPISMSGVKPNDFTMVFGFPGRTNEYLPSFAIQEIYEVSNPAKIKIRETKLRILDEDMKASDETRIKYAAKYASISNYHKKWIGENRGLKKLDAVNRKKEQEQQFMAWVNESEERRQKYGNVLADFEKNYKNLDGITLSRDYMFEAGLGVELISYAQNYVSLMDMYKNKAPEAEINKLLDRLEKPAGFLKNYNQATDKKVFEALMPLYYKNTAANPNLQPDFFQTVQKKYKGDFGKYADMVYGNTFMTSEARIKETVKAIRGGNTKAVEKDPAYQIARSIIDNYRNNLHAPYTTASDNINLLSRTYVAGLREMQKDRKFYPDANSTLRVAYGQVKGYEPSDGVYYEYYTTLDGLMEKADPTHVDFMVPDRLVELYNKKDYGPYAVNGTVPVAFIATNHTTGGNSGSPVINANGELIGTNFDRNWEGTMSDIMYDPDRVRNITLDVRYTLFVIDKFAGAGHLLQEMTLVGQPQTPPAALKDQSGKGTPELRPGYLNPKDRDRVEQKLKYKLKSKDQKEKIKIDK